MRVGFATHGMFSMMHHQKRVLRNTRYLSGLTYLVKRWVERNNVLAPRFLLRQLGHGGLCSIAGPPNCYCVDDSHVWGSTFRKTC